ncbi:hypothetical protein Hanom_Chr16g01480971 [Helianthus anomalus]
MNGRNKKNETDIRKIGELSIKYRSYIGQISDNIADIIGTDILTNILYRGRGPITDISLIYRDINYIGYNNTIIIMRLDINYQSEPQ